MRKSRKIYYIDDDCDSGSFIGYSIYQYDYGKKPRQWEAKIDLADCSRRISWYIHPNRKGIQKLDKAIKILQELRDKLDNG